MGSLDKLASVRALDDLASLIAPLGDVGFAEQFYAVCRRLFGNDQCNVFVFENDLGVSPKCLISLASDAPLQSLTRDLSVEYMKEGFRRDPTLAWAKSQRSDQNASLQLRSVSQGQVTDLSYRRRFYDYACVREKMAILSRIGPNILYVNLYRNSRQREFSSDERRLLSGVGDFLCKLLHKHSRLVAQQDKVQLIPKTAFHGKDQMRLFDDLRHALLSEGVGLTPREADICASIALGVSREGIGLTYGISANTVATHRKRAYAKLGVSSQSELFARYIDALRSKILSAA